MSVQTLYTAATGMRALETKLDVIANNLANVNTTAFKRDRTNFEDLFYKEIKLPGTIDAQQNYAPVGIQVGLGTRVQGIQTDYSQGGFSNTNNQLDVAINGPGFFVVLDPNSGQQMFTRAGNLSVNSNNQLVIGSAQTGRQLFPAVQVPQDTMNITIGPDGTVQVQQANNSQFTTAGQIQLARFFNPQGLLKNGENLYSDTLSSGPAQIATPGTIGLGTVLQNTLELSNVDPVTELVDLITTQRSFELNSQAVQAGDQMLQLIGNLRRF